MNDSLQAFSDMIVVQKSTIDIIILKNVKFACPSAYVHRRSTLEGLFEMSNNSTFCEYYLIGRM